MGTQALALLAALNAACDGIDQLAAAIDKNFRQHPDYAIITSFPGLAARVDLGACVISSVCLVSSGLRVNRADADPVERGLAS